MMCQYIPVWVLIEFAGHKRPHALLFRNGRLHNKDGTSAGQNFYGRHIYFSEQSALNATGAIKL